MKTVAALDLGSNSFLCLIIKGENQKLGAVISDQMQIVKLGEGVDVHKKLSSAALERARKCLIEFSHSIQSHRPEKILAVATSAARDATNSDELFKICADLNIPLQILTGDQEAEVSFRGSLFDQPAQKNCLVVDIGGGSTEFIFGTKDKFEFRKSLDVGGVRYFERYIQTYPLSQEKLNNLDQKISEAFEKVIGAIENQQIDRIVAVAGTPTALAAAELGRFDEKQVHGYELKLESLQDWKKKLAFSTHEEKILMKVEPKRADIILVGVCILEQLLQKLHKEVIYVSTKGVRYGVALQLLDDSSDLSI